MSAKKKKEKRAILKRFDDNILSMEYLKESAKKYFINDLDPEDSLEEWYLDACLVKALDENLDDQELMPGPLIIHMIRFDMVDPIELISSGLLEIEKSYI